MHHVKPTSKGDPLCPLGFHPQVRWPTRCKRCFRDYKEHGNRGKDSEVQLRKDELTVSTPVLSTTAQRNRLEPTIPEGNLGSRNWTSSSNLSTSGISNKNDDSIKSSSRLSSSSSSWTSTPNLAESKDDVSVSITLPRRRSKPPELDRPGEGEAKYTRSNTRPSPEYSQEEDDARRTHFTVRRRTSPGLSSISSNYNEEKIEPKTASLSIPLRSRNLEKEEKRDTNLTAEIEQLKRELEAMKVRCEKAEREKSDFLMRRLDTTTSRTSSSEILKLQQKVNELRITVDDLQVDKKSLSQKVRDLQYEIDSGRGSGQKRETDTLKEKLKSAERMCKELMEQNEDMKKEIKEMEDEMDEMHDKFREDRADEYSMLKKELDQSTKNCRILSFKLRKAERKCEQLEVEKFEVEQRCREVAGGQHGLDKTEKIKKLEHELSIANETSERLQKELEELRLVNSDDKSSSVPTKKRPPKLGTLPKTPSGEKVSRESLTRGDSQEDPVQLLRDLQDSLEREADLREQLRFAEEEAENLRKKAARVEDDNESLVLQLKKMASKARTRRHSPSQQRLTPEPVEKDEGISDEDDPSELRILLELNEQEAAVLRRKVEELESEGNLLKRKVKELQDKLSTKIVDAGKEKRTQIQQAEPKKINAIYDQKIKVLEEEMSELRKKVIEKERECERLHAEISVGTKKPKTLQKSKSLDMDQQTVDLRRQLQVIESEASVLRSKLQNLETENEKLIKENSKLSLLASKRSNSVERSAGDSKNIGILEKQLEESNKKIKELEEKLEKKPSAGAKAEPSLSVSEIEKLKNQLRKAEAEKKKHEETLQRLRDSALKDVGEFYKSRTPKKPTDLTTKLQLKKMVDELENEIGDILVVLNKTEESRSKLSGAKGAAGNGDLKEEKEKFERLIKEAKDDCQKKDLEIEKLNKMIENLERDKIKVMRERDSSKSTYESEIEKLNKGKNELEKQKKEVLSQIEKLNAELSAKKGLNDEVESLKKQMESLRKELADEKKTSISLKAKVETSDKKLTEITKYKQEISDSNKKIEELETKLADVEDKLKKSEKLANVKKDKVVKLDKEYTELNKKYTALEKELEAATISKHDIASKYEDAEARISKLKVELESKNMEIKKLENAAKSKENLARVNSSDSKLLEELNSTKKKLADANEKLVEAEKQLKEKVEEMTKQEKRLTKQVEEWEQKASDLEMDLQANRKMMERLKATQEREMKSKDTELLELKQNLASVGQEKLKETKKELQDKIDALELALDSEKHEYDDLTKRYEELEEEHVVMKATLVKEKEKVQTQLVKAANELEDVENELRSLKESYHKKQDYWIQEKHKMEEKSKEYETLTLQKSRLQALSEDKQSEIEQLKTESKCLAEQLNYLRKDNDDLRSKLEDYENLDRVQRNVSGTASLENELKDYKSRLASEEKARKKEMSSLRMKYENRLTLISEEILAMQSQMTRLKKERDSYKHLLEAARKNISELKTSGHSLSKGSPNENELRRQVGALENQLGVLEDELSESRLDASKLRTELNTERANWEIRVSELTSRLNEMEEDKILSSGRTRVSGTKTRMELAWHKEREEQHRLLQETSTLARDLRQTLFEVERERDRERLEAKRKLDQLKKSNEEEQEEIKKKLNEMQCDLLELRDAHAKLRTTNEKLRREKDRLERDRDLLKQSINIKKKIEQEEERQIISVAQLVEELTVLAPDLFPSKPLPPMAMPTPPVRRKGPKSREASPALERKDYSRESSVGRDDAKSHEVQEILRRLTEAANELKKVQQEDRATFRKAFGSFRSSSVESDGDIEASNKVRRRGLQRKPSLLRKSLSLDQTTAEEQQVWTDNEKEGSVTSFQSLEDSDAIRQAHLLRDMSLDSRLSGGSTQSEIIPHEKKKKLGLFGKLKKLTKSRSIDQDSDMGSSSQLDPGSDSSLTTAEDRSGKAYKTKFGGMFKKSGSTSRGNSMERNVKSSTPVSDSTQRPLLSGGAVSPNESLKPLVKKPPATAPVQRKTFKK